MLDKKVLTEEFIIHDQIPSILKIDTDLLLQKALLNFHNKKRVNEDPFYYDYHYTKLDDNKNITWVQDYIRDHYKTEYNKTPILTKSDALIQAEGDTIGNHHHIDDWDYEGSPDISALYCLEAREKPSYIMFEYACGRDRKRRWRMPMKTGQVIIFSSSLLHSLTRNENKDPIINLSFQFQLL